MVKKKGGKKRRTGADAKKSSLTFVGAQPESVVSTAPEDKKAVHAPSAGASAGTPNSLATPPSLSRNVCELRFMRRAAFARSTSEPQQQSAPSLPKTASATHASSSSPASSGAGPLHPSSQQSSSASNFGKPDPTTGAWVRSAKYDQECRRTDNIWRPGQRAGDRVLEGDGSAAGGPRVVGRRGFGGLVPFLEQRALEEKSRRTQIVDNMRVLDEAEMLAKFRKERK